MNVVLLCSIGTNGRLLRACRVTDAQAVCRAVEGIQRYIYSFIGQHRRNHNRLGVGIQLCYLRHLGRVLGPDEALPL
jgi:Domain of unknown function (DUF4158)